MTDKSKPASYSYDGLDRVIHEKARLGIMTSLISHPKGLGFTELKQLCDLTDGNLSRHIGVLQEAGFVTVKKTFVANRPHTSCSLSTKGKKEFAKYLDVLEQIVRDATAVQAVASTVKNRTAS